MIGFLNEPSFHSFSQSVAISFSLFTLGLSSSALVEPFSQELAVVGSLVICSLLLVGVITFLVAQFIVFVDPNQILVYFD